MEPGIMKPDESPPPVRFHAKTPAKESWPACKQEISDYHLEMEDAKDAPPRKELMERAKILVSEGKDHAKQGGKRPSFLCLGRRLVKEWKEKGVKFIRVEFDGSSEDMRKERELGDDEAAKILGNAVNNACRPRHRKTSRRRSRPVPPTKPAPVSGGTPPPPTTTTTTAAAGSDKPLAPSFNSSVMTSNTTSAYASSFQPAPPAPTAQRQIAFPTTTGAAGPAGMGTPPSFVAPMYPYPSGIWPIPTMPPQGMMPMMPVMPATYYHHHHHPAYYWSGAPIHPAVAPTMQAGQYIPTKNNTHEVSAAQLRPSAQSPPAFTAPETDRWKGYRETSVGRPVQNGATGTTSNNSSRTDDGILGLVSEGGLAACTKFNDGQDLLGGVDSFGGAGPNTGSPEPLGTGHDELLGIEDDEAWLMKVLNADDDTPSPHTDSASPNTVVEFPPEHGNDSSGRDSVVDDGDTLPAGSHKFRPVRSDA